MAHDSIAAVLPVRTAVPSADQRRRDAAALLSCPPDEAEARARRLARSGSAAGWAALMHLLHGSPLPHGVPLGDPIGALIVLSLSTCTSEHQYVRAFRSLMDVVGRPPAWGHLADVTDGELLSAVRAVGHPRRRLATLRAIGALVTAGDLTPAALAELPPGDALEMLTSIPGVGVKVARAALVYGADADLAIVDRHTARVTRRVLGLPPAADQDVVRLLEEHWPPGTLAAFHASTLAHGRAVCGARPGCAACSVRQECATGRESD